MNWNAAALPLALSAFGALISEKAGVLNISLEGCMIAGAFTAAALAVMGVPIGIALTTAALAGSVLGLLLAFVHLKLGSNLFIAGLGINLLAPALANLISGTIWGHKGVLRITPDPAAGFWNILPWFILPMALILAGFLKKTAAGRALCAAGESAGSEGHPFGGFLAERGYSRNKIQTAALAVSSAAAAFSGAILVFRIHAYVPGMSSGRGWIALVLVWLGFRRPLGIALASYLFAILILLSNRAQGLATESASLLLSLPYLIALAALIPAQAGRSARRKKL